MYCKNCGTEIDDNARFCVHCGCDQTAPAPPQSRQPAGFPGQRPSSYLVLSIITTVLCCVPFGVVGIVYATKVDPAWNAGNYDDAWTFSRKARNWSLWGIALVTVFYIIYIALLVVGVSWAHWWDDTDMFFTRCLF